MSLRYPAVPLITSDPYFSVWSFSDKLNADHTKHWTGRNHRIMGYITIDHQKYCFMGLDESCPSLPQLNVQVNALSTHYIFATEEVGLELIFTSPLLPEELLLISRPVSYLEIRVRSRDHREHRVFIRVTVDDEIALDYKGEYKTVAQARTLDDIAWVRVGSETQNILAKCGDDLRINWGYFYLAVRSGYGNVYAFPYKNENGIQAHDLYAETEFTLSDTYKWLLAFAYDDVMSVEYFGKPLPAYWKTVELDIETAISRALMEYERIFERCRTFGEKLYIDALCSGGEEYAELLALAYRQSVAAHKLCVDENGNLLFISKECFSNGCAATVDVTFPSAPLYLLYAPELLAGMLRPVFNYAATDEWIHDFPPHDVGTYPIINGQVYGGGTDLKCQMPIEECGNMLILSCSLSIVFGNTNFAREHWCFLKKWADYLVEHTFDESAQLCTDDFAGHLAFNTNLILKGILGVTAFSFINRMHGDTAEADFYWKKAEGMKQIWFSRARKSDGTYKLAFDHENSFSIKYNLIWNFLWGDGIFSMEDFRQELLSYRHKRLNRYGIPLDNRADYSKPEWMIFAASLFEDKADFEAVIHTIWQAYNDSPQRVPLMDWYDTKTAEGLMFRNRTVVGGFFMKLLKDSGKCRMPVPAPTAAANDNDKVFLLPEDSDEG